MGVSRRAAQFGLGAAVAVLLLCLSILIAGGIDAGIANGLEGTRARNFHLRDLENHLVSLSDLRGKVVGVYFSGDTASPQTDPQVAALQKDYADDARVKMLAVYNQDLTSHDARKVVQSIASRDRVATLTDPTAEVSKQYKVGQTPTLFVIDQEGVIRLRVPTMGAAADVVKNCHKTIDELLAMKPTSLAQGVLSNVK
jgi:peroxiredoxin